MIKRPWGLLALPLQWRRAPGGEGILPSHAPTGAHGLKVLRSDAPCGAGLLASPLQRRRTPGGEGILPSYAPTGAHGPTSFAAMRLAAHSEGKMPSPPGPVATQGRDRLGEVPCLRGSLRRSR